MKENSIGTSVSRLMLQTYIYVALAITNVRTVCFFFSVRTQTRMFRLILPGLKAKRFSQDRPRGKVETAKMKYRR